MEGFYEEMASSMQEARYFEPPYRGHDEEEDEMRISGRTVVQLVESEVPQLVVVNDEAGEEITLTPEQVEGLLKVAKCKLDSEELANLLKAADYFSPTVRQMTGKRPFDSQADAVAWTERWQR